MSDMITAEEAQELLARGAHLYNDPRHYPPLMQKCAALARTVIALHAQLADAKAAQAMVVGEAVKEGMRIATSVPIDQVPQAVDDAIRALAPVDGLAAVEALRKERDHWETVAIARYANRLKAEADRDRLAAANAALEAQVARLVGALTPSGDTKAAYMGEIKDPDTKRMVSWTAIKMVMAMISARAALASAQADARREGGE